MNLNCNVFEEISENEKINFVKSLLAERVQVVIDKGKNLRTLKDIEDKIREAYQPQ